ncbi:citrate/2-methylcitrate synthase [Ruminococcus sp.]|uniref:citrate/2-methylcitrate synthase n=1 Tax=Ruminococcus sp. TaxID=41978 RepID=UPI0025ED6F92|nr:citrate/2-methylcitrate synthase [Ruminococcus sp.]MCI5816147.1 citrate/2-methylcitrate synthase [Ruminococcus sp.]MDD7556690.1 citrate/2-methylcitrate synthase [Ruminococcus sp.]MDY4963296.1 citrate/2-methylcitrate synthase [Ruminococcus callidus]
MGKYQSIDLDTKIGKLVGLCEKNYSIDPVLYQKYDVKRGLRDINGQGVRAGLTNISNVSATAIVDGESVPARGKLYYRGIDVEQIVKGFSDENRFGFEETVYLLLFGELPDREALRQFQELLAEARPLPTTFTRDVIMKSPSDDMMNTLARSVLTLYSYDPNPNDLSISNVLKQCIRLIAQFPSLAVYGYQAFEYYKNDESLFLHHPNPELSTAENILYMLRPDSKYTDLEAKILDLALVLHAEHGGGNNSSFTVHVVSSSGTDTYSAIAAALGSLKGPKHGGANIKVVHMFDDMMRTLPDWTDEEAVKNYLRALLHKEAFDHAGLIYGMGHAVYSISDPRATVFKSFVEKLSEEKGYQKEFALYSLVERLAPGVIAEERRIYKGVCANVDFYSGFVYRMLGLPYELFTPIFAISRIAGWSAHRLEELINANKIIRPAYKAVKDEVPYQKLEDR